MRKNFLLITFTILMAAGSVPALGQWVRQADAYKTRSEVTSVVYGGKLYSFLGFSNSILEAEPSVEVYDPGLNAWQLLGSLPLANAVTHQGVILIDDNVWHIGGRVGADPGPLTAAIWIYNISSNSWSPGPLLLNPATGLPLLWGGGGAALLGRTLHVIGGFVNSACNGDQETHHLTLNIDDWLANPLLPAPWKNDLAPLPSKRNHFGTVVLGGKIYAIGGQFGHDCGGGEDTRISHVYDPSTDNWTELPLLPTPRSHIEGGVFAMDGKIYVVAGQGTGGVSTNKVTIFDPAGNNGEGSWADDDNLTLPTGYEGVSAKVVGSTFIISHGGEGSSANTRNTTYSRTIERDPVYELGFSSGCATLNVSSGNLATTNTLLFTIDGTKNYTTSSSASWLTVTENSSGTTLPNGVEIELTANPAGLAPGTYNAIVTATGTTDGPAYTPAEYCVNLVVAEEGPLPLTWLYFNAKEISEGVELDWGTANEINTASISIERSLDGNEFIKIGSVNAVATGKYQFIDGNALNLNKNTLYYRLRQIDQDGKYSFSTVQTVRLKDGNDASVRVSPNPFTNTLTLQVRNSNRVDAKDNVELYSAEGKLVYRRNLGNRNNSATISLDDLPALGPGVYLLKTFLNGRATSLKVIRK